MNEESFFVPPFPSPPRRRNRSIQETGAINVSKSATARERESDQRIPCVGKKGRSASLEFDIGTRQIHAYLEAFALLIKGGPRPRASKRRAAKKRGGRRRRLSSCALPPSSYLETRRIDACTCASRSSTKDTKRSGARRFYANLCGPKSLGRRRQPT